MEIKLESDIVVYVEPGKYVYDEISDTWISWDLLETSVQNDLLALSTEIEGITQAVRERIKQAAHAIESNAQAVLARGNKLAS